MSELIKALNRTSVGTLQRMASPPTRCACGLRMGRSQDSRWEKNRTKKIPTQTANPSGDK